MAATGGDASSVGIDGCPGGWVAAVRVDDALLWRTAGVGAFGSLLASLPADGCIIAVDMPVGLAERGWRPCDVLAKQALGRAHARVFLTPPRAVIELGPSAPNARVQACSRELTGQGVSRQALALAPRILDVDEHLPDQRIIEAHPELSFAAIAGRVLMSKHDPAGLQERSQALASAWPDADIQAWLATRPARVPLADALDALALAWTADRHATGRSTSLPEQPPTDDRGVPMMIVT
ncbi:MAG: DUF429 domain-containing protein [Actinomycetales bacterium]|nr:DUF429 domain-containing protein [Actinomycetales bacterium]